jgi:peptide chain release factor 2
VVATIDHLTSNLADNSELYEMSKDEGDVDGLLAIEADAAKLEATIAELEFRRMFNNPLDPSNCFIDIQAGAGRHRGVRLGGDAAAPVPQVLRAQGLQDRGHGRDRGRRRRHPQRDDQGRGRVRVRPAAHRDRRAPAGQEEPVRFAGGRHTSFASLFVYPEVDDSIEIEINPADVRTDTFRASGAGGQHINKTDSAVRLTHIPTGIVVQCQNDRSQHRNRDEAWQMLRSRLYEHELRIRMAAQQKLEDTKTDVGWGHQIRSYVLDQSRIKDLRTNVEISNTQKVLDGDLDPFIEASLKQGV